MGPAEILHRFHERVAIGRLRLRQAVRPRRYAGPAAAVRPAFCTATAPQIPTLPWEFEPDRDDIERLLEGRAQALGTPWTWREDPCVWHRAPDTGNVWPRSFFSTIEYRAGNPCGDVRFVWEPARLQHLIPLGLLAARRADQVGRRAADLLARQLVSWVHANPPYLGVHYVSAMECGLRILAACHAVDLARQWFPPESDVWTALVSLVQSHAEFIAARPSQFSSSGNHTLAECAGLVYAGALFPELAGAPAWLAAGGAGLDREARRQIFPDGGGLEQAWWYLAFNVDVCGLVAAVLRHHGQPVPPGIPDAHARGRDFLRTFAAAPSSLPLVGDTDGGFALSAHLRLSWQGIRADMPGVLTFKDAGCSFLRVGSDAVIVDHGSLGMPPLYGHGHADALSVTLCRDQRDVLIDPGTFTYTGDPAWRKYFRGTAAHNTVTVDGMDQADQETAFQWSRPYSAELAGVQPRGDGTIALLARHDGYLRLGVEHWRGVAYRPGAGWLIWDYLVGRGSHRLDLHWHFGVEVIARPDGVRLPDLSPTVRLAVTGGTPAVLRGETAPISGWRSTAYGRKEPCATLRVRFEGALPHEFVTRLAPDGAISDSSGHKDLVLWFRKRVGEVSRTIFNATPTQS